MQYYDIVQHFPQEDNVTVLNEVYRTIHLFYWSPYTVQLAVQHCLNRRSGAFQINTESSYGKTAVPLTTFVLDTAVHVITVCPSKKPSVLS